MTRTELLYAENGHIKRWNSNGPTLTVVPFTATLTLHRPAYQRIRRDLQPETPQRALGIVNPAVSTDGASIAFTALGDLWILPIGAQPLQLTNDRFVELDPAWSPDGRRLAFACDRGGHMDLWIHDFLSGADTKLTDEQERGAVSGPAWSPDGQDVAYLVNHRDLGVVNLAARGRPERTRVSSGALDLGRPTWPPDGKRVAVGQLFSYASPFNGTKPMLASATLGFAMSGFEVRSFHDPSLLSDARLDLLPAAAARYRSQAAFFRNRPDEVTPAERDLKALQTTIAAITAAGGKIVAGSGASAGSGTPDVPAGLGLHAELELFVEAGLTPLQALRAATANAAEALGVADELGTIEPGKLADLVIVGGDPLRDIKSVRDVRAVIRGGRYYAVSDLLSQR